MTKVPATGSSLDDGLKAYRPCVGIMLINRGGLVWIGRRPSGRAYSNEGGDTWWQMPQGGIDEAEDPARAARRELYEETGITSVGPIAEHPAWLKYDLPPGLAPGSWGGKYRGQRQKWFALRFLGEDAEVNIVPPAGHEVEFVEWRWAPVSELVDLIVPFKRPVYEQVVAEFTRYAAPVA